MFSLLQKEQAPKILKRFFSSLGEEKDAIVILSVWPAILGIALAYLGKSWYLDRMVWLYEDMKHLPEYGEWLY